MKVKKTIGITGAGGSLGKALTKIFQKDGHQVIGLTHNKKNLEKNSDEELKWIYWECGKEDLLTEHLTELDILILNHGIYETNCSNSTLENSIKINSMSTFKILSIFERIALEANDFKFPKEIWINTSEAEIFPALSPSYEVSKSLIGQLITIKKFFQTDEEKRKFIIRKIILGPFQSKLNPIGVLDPDIVAFLINFIWKLNLNLIIVTINPLTYIFMPCKEFYFGFYYGLLKKFNVNKTS